MASLRIPQRRFFSTRVSSKSQSAKVLQAVIPAKAGIAFEVKDACRVSFSGLLKCDSCLRRNDGKGGAGGAAVHGGQMERRGCLPCCFCRVAEVRFLPSQE
jgi:hypothetical protein